jgi:predicted methyltransferase
MKQILLTSVALAFAMGCESRPSAEQNAPPTAPTSAAAITQPQPSAEELQQAEEAKAAEKKKADDALKLQQDFDELKVDNEKELARWTPKLRANAKSVADKAYPNGKAAIQASLAGKYRKPGNPERDTYRHPLQTLEFFGFKPDMTVLEYGPGEGWFTEVLAPSLAKKGKLIVTSTDPNGPKDQRSTLYGERQKLFLERSPELYSKVQTVIIDGKNPDLKIDGKVDLILLMRGMHGMVNAGTLDKWLAEFNTALKPKGILGIEQHRAKADAKPEESAKKGYLPQAWVIEKVEAAGFKLVGKSEINANPKDTKDYPGGVWTLPPTYAEKDKDREKYQAIGESDRMTLKFERVASKK